MNISRLESREEYIFKKLERPRLEGQHVTDCIYCNVKAWGYARLGMVGDVPKFDRPALLRMLMGTAMGNVLEEGEMSQMPSIAPDTEDVGTLDVYIDGHAAEIKVTYASSLKDINDMPHWIEQLGEYTWRTTDRKRKTPCGEMWAIHLLGDQGKKRCPEHGVPNRELKARHPDTNRPRLICPACADATGEAVFLADGDRDTALRCHRVEWTWEELDSLHRIHAWRQGFLQGTITNPAYGIGMPPPIEWGYDFECGSCKVKDRVGCPGRGEERDLEAELTGSIMELKGARV